MAGIRERDKRLAKRSGDKNNVPHLFQVRNMFFFRSRSLSNPQENNPMQSSPRWSGPRFQHSAKPLMQRLNQQCATVRLLLTAGPWTQRYYFLV
jgi:hypothetical protein